MTTRGSKMTPKCLTCAVPVEERPGWCEEHNCPCNSIYVGDPKWLYPGYQPREGKSLCYDCARDYFQKDCGNCANWTKDISNNSIQGHCNLDGLAVPENHKSTHPKPGEPFSKLKPLCSWKPICEKCGGTGEVCKNGHHQRKACLGPWTPIPCPACTEEKSKRLGSCYDVGYNNLSYRGCFEAKTCRWVKEGFTWGSCKYGRVFED